VNSFCFIMLIMLLSFGWPFFLFLVVQAAAVSMTSFISVHSKIIDRFRILRVDISINYCTSLAPLMINFIVVNDIGVSRTVVV
jgi:hypothetical protein